MKIDFNKEYTEAELDAIRAHWDFILLQIINSTIVLCGGAVIDTFVFRFVTILLK
jgi:hypothetical protein